MDATLWQKQIKLLSLTHKKSAVGDRNYEICVLFLTSVEHDQLYIPC